jgi:hypothetical protein
MSNRAHKPTPEQLTPKQMGAIVRALDQILSDLRQGKWYQITRLTRIKRLCTDAAAATQFAAFIAERSLQRLYEREPPEGVAPEDWQRYVALATEGAERMRLYLAEQTPEAQSALREQLRALEQSQRAYQNIPYGAVRLITCWEAMLVETALRCMLTPQASERLGYELARYYVERYNPHYGAGLIPESAEPLAEVIDFWRAYAAEQRAQSAL